MDGWSLFDDLSLIEHSRWGTRDVRSHDVSYYSAIYKEKNVNY